MHDFIQPYLNEVVSTLLSLVGAIIATLAILIKQRVSTYVAAHTTLKQRETLHLIASEAVAYAGTVFKEQGGEQKLTNAITYVNDHLHTSFTEAEVRGVIEKAYAAYKAQNPAVDTPAAPVEPAPVETPVATVEPAPVETPVSPRYVAPAPLPDVQGAAQ